MKTHVSAVLYKLGCAIASRQSCWPTSPASSSPAPVGRRPSRYDRATHSEVAGRGQIRVPATDAAQPRTPPTVKA